MKIGRQIIISTIGYVLSFLLGPISIKILTTGLSASGYGIYSLIFSTIGIAFIFLTFGFDNYLFAKIPGEEKTKGFSFFTSTYIFELIVASIVAILTIGIGIPLVKYFKLDISPQIIFFSTLILLFSILVTESLRFHGLRKRLEFKTVMGLFQERLWVLPLFFLWWFARKITLEQTLLIRLPPSFLVLFISLWAMKKKGETVGNNKIFEKKIVTGGLIFGVPLIILSFGDTLLNVADRYVIALFWSTTAVGYYSLVYALVNIGYGLAASIIWISSPYFAESYNLGKKDNFQLSKAKDIFNCSLKLCLIVSFFISVVLFLLRVPLIQLLSSKEYLVGATAMALLVPFPILLILTYLSHQVLILENQRRVLIKGYIFAPLFNLALNFILIPKFGINGAAAATVASYLFMSLFFLSKVKKYNVLEFPKSQFLKLGICLLLAITPIYFLNPFSIIEIFYSGTISSMVYLLSLIMFKIITKKDWNILFPYSS